MKSFFLSNAILVAFVLAVGCAQTPKQTKSGADKEALEEGDALGELQVETATADAQDAKAARKMSPEALGVYNDAVKAASAGKLTEAESLFNQVLRIDKRAVQAAYNLGVLSERKGDGARARRYYGQAIGIQEDFILAVSALVSLEVRAGKADDAVSIVAILSNKYPDHPKLLSAYADALILAGQYDEAIGVAKRALRIDERDAAAILRIGKANYKLGRLELASSVFDQVLKINPDEAEVFFYRALMRVDEDRTSAAIEEFKKALEKRPSYVEAMNNLAVQYIYSGNYQDAIGQLRKALNYTPTAAVLHLNYGNALRGAGLWKEAKIHLERAWKLDSGLKGSLLNLGILFYVAKEIDNLDRIGRMSEAKKYFAMYKGEMGSALTKDDQVHKYIKEVQLALERESTRIEQEKERIRLEDERARQRAAAEAKGEDPDKKQEDADGEGWEEDDGWE